MEEGRKLVYIRVYSGKLTVGEEIYNVNLDKKEKVSRIYKIHANHKDRVEEAPVGRDSRHSGPEGDIDGPYARPLQAASSSSP